MMKFAITLVAVLAVAGYANAECANACSGHGTCFTNDECECFPNWMANDCSQRVCPYGLSFVDTPRGDLNHDGLVSLGGAADTAGDGLVQVRTSALEEFEQYPTAGVINADADEGHFYTECSNKGLCDRESGLCQCFAGYSGSSCQRTTCPNDCSGHGVCRTVEEIAANGMNYKKTDSVATENFWEGINQHHKLTYRLWDMDKAQSCVCDHGYSGPDCSRRECPRGDDPLTHRPTDCGGETCRDEVQVFQVRSTTSVAAVDWMYILFQDWTGQTWRTDMFQFGDACSLADTDLESILSSSLQAIPNSVFEGVTVDVTINGAADIDVSFTFTHNSGNLATLEFVNLPADQLTRNNTCAGSDVVQDFDVIELTSADEGNKEESPCSNRGLCDYTTGLCKCFRGYYSDDCSLQNALAGSVSASA